MKNVKRILILVLALSVIASESVIAFAKGSGPYVVTCIGDSSPNGNCLSNVAMSPRCSPRLGLVYTNEPTYTAADDTVYQLGGAMNGDKRVGYRFYLPEDISPAEYEAGMLQSYPVLVAEAMNGIDCGSVTDFKTFYRLTDYRSMTAAAMRTGDVLYALDPTYSQNDALWNLPMTALSREALATAVKDGAIEEADCVILAFGSNDVFAGPVYDVVAASSNGENLLSALKNGIQTGLQRFKENFPKIMENLQQRNSDCVYVITGAYNPFYQYTLQDILMMLGVDIGIFGDLTEIGNLADLVINPINTVMREVAAQYDNVIYVDSYGIPLFTDEIAAGNKDAVPTSSGEAVTVTGSDATAISSSPLMNSIHPTPEGHAYLARRIIAAIEQLQSEDRNALSVDVAGMGEIRYVLCNGQKAAYTLSADGKTAYLSGTGCGAVVVSVYGQDGWAFTKRVWVCTLSNSGYWTRILKEEDDACPVTTRCLEFLSR